MKYKVKEKTGEGTTYFFLDEENTSDGNVIRLIAENSNGDKQYIVTIGVDGKIYRHSLKNSIADRLGISIDLD